jgi:hypothetical protein
MLLDDSTLYILDFLKNKARASGFQFSVSQSSLACFQFRRFKIFLLFSFSVFSHL